MKGHFKKLALALSVTAVVSTPVMASSTQAEAENPSFLAMTGDLLVARPLMLATTAVGAVAYVISSPFAALGGNLDQTGQTLVVEPFNATFKRCLGCTSPNNEGL
ncbi:hypothetical protein [Parendozoicomonas haliclonae]|uniref:Multidrug transporter n=1 Tax=Parendozoicomonas haliclonae TaxID=1960125 RepID=A0A1X7ALM0_9GAMM|nr:hypothetical protein [Parendozoicomonas haliclonae]SMA48505.1 hypothetical protein EHSB41UT_02770 [Parendozoicomonas haliclonae]